MKQKTIRSLISLVLLFSFVFGCCGAAFSASDSADIIINPDTVDKVISGYITSDKPSLGIQAGSSVEYSVQVDTAGLYNIFATNASEKNSQAKILLTVNGADASITPTAELGWSHYWEGNDYVNVYGEAALANSLRLEQGKNTIKITAKDGDFRLIELRLSCVFSDDAEKAFLSDLNSAETTKEVEECLKAYDGKVPTSYSELLDGIFYKDIIYEQMLCFNHTSISETDAYLKALVEEEKREPLVSVFQNGQAVTSLTPGAVTVKIGAKFEKGLSVVAAIYEWDRLSGAVTGTVSAYTPLRLSGLTASEEAQTLRVFFWIILEIFVR